MTEPTLADRILGHALLALTRWRRGAAELALEAAEWADRASAGSDQVSHYLLEAYAALAEVYLGLWAAHASERERGREFGQRVARLGKVLGRFQLMYPISAAHRWLVWGHYYRLSGRVRTAGRSWRKGLAAAQHYHMPHEQGLAHRALQSIGVDADS